MINQRNISGLLIVTAMAVYLLFGDPDCYYWSTFYFCLWNIIVVYIGGLVLKSHRDKLLNIVIKIVMGVSLSGLVLNLYSFFDIELFNKINRSYEAGAIIVGCILVFITYKNNGVAKRQTRITMDA